MIKNKEVEENICLHFSVISVDKKKLLNETILNKSIRIHFVRSHKIRFFILHSNPLTVQTENRKVDLKCIGRSTGWISLKIRSLGPPNPLRLIYMSSAVKGLSKISFVLN